MPAPTQRQILDRRRAVIPPVPAMAADPKPAPTTTEQIAHLIALHAETNRLLAEVVDRLNRLTTGGR